MREVTLRKGDVMEDKGVQELQKQQLEVVEENQVEQIFQDRGDYIELKNPAGNIHMIEKVCSNENFTWDEAIKYAKNLKKGGFSDWRLPTKEELMKIYEIKKKCEINEFNDCFWSSSTYNGNTDYAWLMHFYFGKIYYSYKKHKCYVRCVR